MSVDPGKIYGTSPEDGRSIQLFISPAQYIQGQGTLKHLGRYLSVCSSGRAGVLITPGRNRVLGDIIEESLAGSGFSVEKTIFAGESTLGEVNRVASFFGDKGGVNVIAGFGGGKCLDTARMAAARLGVPVVTVPTTASTDAPTAAHSVIYDDKGVFSDVEFHSTNPLIVLADLDIIAAAPLRYITAGMGDAFATYYEARCCMENPQGRTARGARPTMAALAIARQCRDALLEHAPGALDELRRRAAGESVARIVEANILLSGLGFESGGLAGAHGVAQGLTAVSDLHDNCLHGELVAVGVVTQLVMEKRFDEAREAVRFFHNVGLPYNLKHLGFDPHAREPELTDIINTSLGVPFIRYEPFDITESFLRASILEAYDFGIEMERELTH